MKKLVLLSILLSFLLLNGCGGDDNGTDPEDPTPTITANITVGSPSFTDPNHIVWNSFTMTTIPISASRPKIAVPKATEVSSNVKVQAIVNNDSLFIRVKWNDDDYSVWRNHYEITKADPPIEYSQSNPLEDEDHLYIMFDGGTEFGWDVWNWRSLTTDAGGLAEGFQFVNDALDSDTGAAIVAFRNKEQFWDFPIYVHKDTSEFTGHILFWNDTLRRGDTTIYGNPVAESRGWTVGQKIPAWLIDTTLDNNTTLDENRRRSRFDIRAVSAYNSTTDEYTVVLGCKLNTGYDDDIDLSAVSSITMKLGIFNNIPGYDNSYFTEGNSNKGFTTNIDLILQ